MTTLKTRSHVGQSDVWNLGSCFLYQIGLLSPYELEHHNQQHQLPNPTILLLLSTSDLPSYGRRCRLIV